MHVRSSLALRAGVAGLAACLAFSGAAWAEPPQEAARPQAGKASSPSARGREAVAWTDGLIRAGEKAIARGQLTPRALSEVQIYQSAAERALSEGKPEVAVWLTLEARRLTRAAFQARGLTPPASHAADRSGESALAQREGAEGFVEAIRAELPPLPAEEVILEEGEDDEHAEEP